MLKDIPLFSGLEDNEIAALEKATIRKKFQKNAILFSEGDATDSLYIIRTGKVKIIINDEEGREVILSILGPGEHFGEMALLDNGPRSACAMTKEPTEVLIIRKKDLMNVFSSSPIVFNLLKGLTNRLRKATKKIEDLALLDVYGRIAGLLTRLAESKNGQMQIEEKLTHQEIANMVGSSREMVSIILKELSKGGYITIDKKFITINKKLPYSW